MNPAHDTFTCSDGHPPITFRSFWFHECPACYLVAEKVKLNLEQEEWSQAFDELETEAVDLEQKHEELSAQLSEMEQTIESYRCLLDEVTAENDRLTAEIKRLTA